VWGARSVNKEGEMRRNAYSTVNSSTNTESRLVLCLTKAWKTLKENGTKTGGIQSWYTNGLKRLRMKRKKLVIVDPGIRGGGGRELLEGGK